MWPGEPRIWPVAVKDCVSRICAMPKSVSFSVRPSWIMTFSGFTSRWTMPCAWAASSAREIWSVMATAISAGSSGC
jgi:hypothetical protein